MLQHSLQQKEANKQARGRTIKDKQERRIFRPPRTTFVTDQWCANRLWVDFIVLSYQIRTRYSLRATHYARRISTYFVPALLSCTPTVWEWCDWKWVEAVGGASKGSTLQRSKARSSSVGNMYTRVRTVSTTTQDTQHEREIRCQTSSYRRNDSGSKLKATVMREKSDASRPMPDAPRYTH